jgi:hypothetical protein
LGLGGGLRSIDSPCRRRGRECGRLRVLMTNFLMFFPVFHIHVARQLCPRMDQAVVCQKLRTSS